MKKIYYGIAGLLMVSTMLIGCGGYEGEEEGVGGVGGYEQEERVVGEEEEED